MLKSKSGIEVADTTTLTKQIIREKVWSFIEDNDLANFPRPVSNRIPNFKGAGEAGQRVRDLSCFTSAQTVKVNPDKPQEEVRFLTLDAAKVLLVPTPRLRSGLFNRMDGHAHEDKDTLRVMAQTEGIKKHSKPVGLDSKVKVDLIVIGSVAVSRTGRRIGKGEGFGDLEYAMMKSMLAVDDSTPVITTVHDCQVFDDLPERLFGQHDVPVDIIVTPTEVFNVSHRLSKPEGIYWHLLTPEKFRQVPILRVLREQEQQAGKDVTLADGVELPSAEELRASGRGARGGGGRGARRGARGAGRGRGVGRGRGRTLSEGEENKAQKNIQMFPREHMKNSKNYANTSLGDSTVTINVSKKNRIVRRTVEATSQPDRLGSADLDDEEHEMGGRMQRPRKPKVPITYAVFLGKVPPACRVRELKDALQDRDVRPVDITWRGRNGFAFLRFTGPAEDCEDVLSKLEGLSLQDQAVVVEKAKDKAMVKDSYENGLYDNETEERAPRRAQVPKKPRLPITYAIFLGKVPPTCRVRELKDALQDREVQPADITWRGRSGFAFLRFTGPLEGCDDVLSKLSGLLLQDQPVVVERAKDKVEEEEEEENKVEMQ